MTAAPLQKSKRVRKRLTLLLGLLLIVILSTIFAIQQIQEQTNSGPSIYYGVYTPPSYPDFSGMQPFELMTGKSVAIVNGYTQWGRTDGVQNFKATWFNRVNAHGSIPMLTWEPWDGNGATQSAFRLQKIYHGSYDKYITKWAQESKSWGHPYFLRFAHEMNGDRYPWSERLNGNSPGDYVKAWKHVHDIFTANGVTNVTWVWCPNIEEPGDPPLAELYPGDEYVDWVAMDGYNFGGKTFSQVFSPTYQHLQQLAPTKPFMIAETSSVEDGSKGRWITDALTVQLPRYFPRIQALIWFNENFSGRDDWVINSSPASLNAFRSAIASSYYTPRSENIDSSPILPSKSVAKDRIYLSFCGRIKTVLSLLHIRQYRFSFV